MHDLSLTWFGTVQQLVKSKQQSTNTGQSMYSSSKLPAHQVKIFGRSALLKKKDKKKKETNMGGFLSMNSLKPFLITEAGICRVGLLM